MTELAERDPVFSPVRGDIVRSEHASIGERHVISANECGVRYYRVRAVGEMQEGYCLPGNWTKWCRAHRVAIIQRGDGEFADNPKDQK